MKPTMVPHQGKTLMVYGDGSNEPKTNTFDLDAHERRLVVSGLRRVRRALIADIRKQKARGWKPEPGKMDNNILRMKSVDKLLERFEHTQP